ncbi:MAG TPA: hypothetical protein EYP14_16195, partial [Planctomycetaceae bacterium]|nr:hypothetical protein [Planctomycetaceae bacterium]
YSMAEIMRLVDLEALRTRREQLHQGILLDNAERLFGAQSDFSAADLAAILRTSSEPQRWVKRLIGLARERSEGEVSVDSPEFWASRLLHSLGTALRRLTGTTNQTVGQAFPGLPESWGPGERHWLTKLSLEVRNDTPVADWADRLRSAAFRELGRPIVHTVRSAETTPRCRVRVDELVWVRAPARLDLGGGWTDTPPYSLERGGAVINVAVDLNGQPPIQAYARVVAEPVIRLSSVDGGQRCEIRSFDDLLDFQDPGAEFSLPKAALYLSGISPDRPNAGSSLQQVLERFGGGIELTTVAAIPKGSGLGTSSIMGAVLLSAIRRLMGQVYNRRELFHDVLRLEQALTTGGGWQDQIGGVVEETKLITTAPGLVPDPYIRFVPATVLDPRENGEQTLLYYTGITRLAKNILQQVVGRYLDRDRQAMRVLRRLHTVASSVADAMARKDLPEFGRLIGEVWELNKQLDPGSTNEQVEALLERVMPYACGAKLLGAGGGGFLLIVCRSPRNAAALRRELEAEPPNELARFFDFSVSRTGVVVSAC